MNMIKYTWQDYKININGVNLNEELIKISLNNLYEQIFKNINDNKLIMIQFKIRDQYGNIRSISYIQTILLSDFNKIIDIFQAFWSLKNDYYHQMIIEDIIFTYKIIDEESNIINNKITYPIDVNLNNKVDKLNFKGFNLPLTMDYTKWGEVIYNYSDSARVQKANSKLTYEIKLFEDHQIVELKLGENVLFEFKDILMNASNLSSFKRVFKNHEYTIENGTLMLKRNIRKCKFLTKINKSPFLKDKFITMDLETRTLNNIMEVYCISIFDGIEIISFYLTDYLSVDEMLTSSIKYLMKRKYHNYKVYLHNFSYFDGIFMLRILSGLSNRIKVIMRDGRIIDIKLPFGSNYNIYFRDSYLMLPSSLSKLAKNFNVESKGTFPYLFVNNSNILLNYEGSIPTFNQFVNMTELEYQEYCKTFKDKIWNLRNETIKYCEQDVITLYQIIEKFNKQIFDLFRLDILKYPTLSSLAFGIYRSNFIGEAKIPLIYGEIYNFIKKGYTGGAVDVYKPVGENIYRYDVNSLYPHVMKEFPMPVGNPTYFEGDITKVEPKPFGFFEVEVIAPKDLNIPILQTKISLNNSIKSIAPLGTWIGVYFSEEIYNAIKFGYKFNILRGYTFDKEYIFKKYVDTLYNLKSNSERNSPNYIISKLLLNSLYGRLGMSPLMEQHKIVTSEEANKIYENKNTVVTNIEDFKNGKELISFFEQNLEKEENNKLNISIPIASAVTAYARIYMSYFKDRYKDNIYYSDTDSIDLDVELDSKYVGSELGKMKLEYIFKNVLFIAPKVYGGILDNEKEIVKIKGFKESVKFNELSQLLYKNAVLKLNQDKWIRNVGAGNIKVQNDGYNLKITENKREIIYKNNKFESTKPFTLLNNEIIKKTL